MRSFLTELRYAARALTHQPTFSIVAILTLTLGIGANTAIFSVTKAVLLNPLPYDDADRLVVLWEVNPDGTLEQVSIPTYGDWAEQATNVEAMAAYRHEDYTFAASEQPLDVPSLKVRPSLFEVLRAEARLGRTFATDEATPGQDHVVVLSHQFWERHFAGRPDVLGETMDLDAEPYTIVGVMAPDFEFPPAGNAQIWTPLSFDPNDMHGRSRRARSLTVIGRMTADTTPAQTQEEMRVIAERIATEYADSNEGWSAEVIAAHEQLVEAARPALLMLTGAVGFLLLIVCANVANLMLARLSGRKKEIAVRAALGAGRWQLARPILAESLVLALAGGGLGLFLAFVSMRLLPLLPEGSLPRMEQIGLDGGVLLFALAISVAVAVAFGLLPALQASRARLRSTLNEASGSTGSPTARRVLNGLVVVEVAMALVLLVGAGLMIRSFNRLIQVSPGFEPNNVIAAQIYLPQTKYQERHEVATFFERVIDRLRAVPGVRSASAASALPMHPVGTDLALPFTVDGRPEPANGEEPQSDVRIATPGYFSTMQVPLLSGRRFDERDLAEAPHVAIINETMATRYFPDEDPLGKVVVNPHGRNEIVGLVGDLKHYGLDSEPRPEIFLPFRQTTLNGMALVLRTETDPLQFAGTIRREVWAVDPGQPIYDLSTMRQVLARAVSLPRLSMALMAIFAATALLLATLGIYGVISYSVSRRTKELGLRMALGAESGDARRLVVVNSMGLVGLGIGVGLVAATVMTRSMALLLYEVSPLDPVVFVGVSVILSAAALAASIVPARRATQIDPIIALREE
ncbi:MAG TPA: permease [Acidobacteria bacterium]|jgi:putative ABC transport system permease protein|nr:ABC transporter permease [Vicinamibacterales bacterium]HAK57320.1 permease [Acidobacteriota bacterium]|tara:strand:- start:8207 stop:10618 length:2412 start_codon:yes stop_codon:yes gene_type:complete